MSTGLTPEERKASINDAARVAVEKNMEAVREQHDYEMQLLRDQLAATLLASNVGVVPDVPSSDPSSKTVPSNPAPPPDQSSNPPIHSVSFSPLIDTPTAVRAVVSTFHDLLGDFPLPVERTDLELENSAMPVISKADRLRLTSSDKNKIYVSFSKGIPSKFKASSTIVGIDEVSTIDNIMSFDQLRLELQRHITSVSAHSVFLILRFNDDGTLIDPDTTAGAPVNILSATVLPSLADIERSTFFHFKRGSLFNQENLVWTYKSIRNSCDKDLQTIIDAKMLKYKPIERFGPLYYYELFQQMTTVDSKAVRAITQELTSLKVPDHEGQSISKVAKYVRSTIIWLNMVSMWPPDIDAIVYDVLDTCTVPDFQLFLKTLSANASLNGVKLTAHDPLDKAESHYRTLVLSKRWDAVGHQGSSFQGQAQRTPNTPAGAAGRRRERVHVVAPSWIHTPPSDSEPHIKDFEGQTYKWCAVCERWFYGDRGHTTSEHVQGFQPQRRVRGAPGAVTSPSTPSASLATTSTPTVEVGSNVPPVVPPASAVTRNFKWRPLMGRPAYILLTLANVSRPILRKPFAQERILGPSPFTSSRIRTSNSPPDSLPPLPILRRWTPASPPPSQMDPFTFEHGTLSLLCRSTLPL